MKFILLILVYLFIWTSSTAQIDYIPIAKDGNLWVYETDIDFGTSFHYSGWYAKGDTSVNNKDYLKVFNVDIVKDENNELNYTQSTIPFALIRDDSITQHSYAIFLDAPNLFFGYDSIFNCKKYDSLNAEILLFDYSYETGDTIEECYDRGISLFFPLVREKVVHLGFDTYIYGNPYGGWYMGLGNVHNLFYGLNTAFIPENIPILKFFCNGILEDCSFNTGPNAVQNLTADAISIHPNPVNDLLTIESEVQLSQIDIIDLLGRTVYTNNQINSPLSINASSFEQGIYTLQIFTNDKKRWTGKFLKN